MSQFRSLFVLAVILAVACCVQAASPIAQHGKKITGKLTVTNNYGRPVTILIDGKPKGTVAANSTGAIAVNENSSKTHIKIVATDGKFWEKRVGDENNPKMTVP